MKKTLIAMAALAAAGVASAQSSVTLYGVVDLGISHGSGNTANWTGMTSGNINSSRLGFKGTEDLGGGLKANFVLEGDVKPFSGTGATSGLASVNSNSNNTTVPSAAKGGFTFNRSAWASLSGGFGELRLGRDYTPTFYADANYDPFGVNGAGTNRIFTNGLAGNVNHLRASNAVSYFLPGNLGGFSGQLMYAFNNTASNAGVTKDDGKYLGGRVGYDAGPISLLVATGQTKSAAQGDVRTTSIAGSYNLGVAKLSAEYSQDKYGAANALPNEKQKGYLLGAVVPVGDGEIHASFVSQKATYDAQTVEAKYNQYSLGYVYNLSKRTALYADYSHVSNKGSAAFALNSAVITAGSSSSGYDIGVRHSF